MEILKAGDSCRDTNIVKLHPSTITTKKKKRRLRPVNKLTHLEMRGGIFLTTKLIPTWTPLLRPKLPPRKAAHTIRYRANSSAHGTDTLITYRETMATTITAVIPPIKPAKILDVHLVAKLLILLRITVTVPNKPQPPSYFSN